ncbi:putative integral peroxisomal membrane [Phaeomoniella chlamydospora]|uniref:Putative integral peroxisomal membrane n=1 Tax=Phaeomoniella chlamydospora TaxID=158046 RepID=A0A0G2DYJ3_PHACM|nr:putative integral peroxisomal membrane [Phaeomoniella chlamydospora]
MHCQASGSRAQSPGEDYQPPLTSPELIQRETNLHYFSLQEYGRMDEYTADAFVNRDDPIPVLTVTADDDAASTSELDASVDEDRGQRLRQTLSGSKLREKAQQYASEYSDYAGGKQSIQDRLFARLLQQLIPGEEPEHVAEGPVDRRSSQYVRRPAFSLPLMTNNFRKFNARIGIVFVFQNRLIRLFTWRVPTHTLSFLAVYTFVCLNPSLLVVVPLSVLLLFIMVPAFLARHPPPPPAASTSSTTPYSYYGPALAPAPTIKPASETSKDFFRNMRDLQNSMADFSMLHDTLVAWIAPPTNFSNEVLSSQIYFYLSIATVILFIAANTLPWRLIALVAGHCLVISGHPMAQNWLQKAQDRVITVSTTPKREANSNLFGYPLPASLSALPPLLQDLSAIALDSSAEMREVEIFELQHRPLTPPRSDTLEEWTHQLYTSSPYDPLSPARISGDRPKGTRFFEDVQPPKGWVWHTKKWELDLEAREWVTERLITGVEFDVSAAGVGGEEFGGWVWDLPPLRKEGFDDDDDIWLAYGGGTDDIHGGGGATKAQKKGKKQLEMQRKAREERRQKDWEEARYLGRTGEWRRRRWVRVVKRVGLSGEDLQSNQEGGSGGKTAKGK